MPRMYRAVGFALSLAFLTMQATELRAEVSEVSLAQQYGIGYLALTVMKHEKLVEKHLAAAGLKDTAVKWSVLGNAVPMNDGLIAGTLHFASGGVAPMISAWDKTRGHGDITGVGALLNAPVYLLTNNPKVKSIRNFTDADRIAMPGAGQSIQTLYLQMAVAKEFGIENYKKLNPLFVNLSHPDAYTALVSKKGTITAHFSGPPFQERAMKIPGITKVTSNFDILGGPTSYLGVWSSAKFRSENPKTYKAVFDALQEATDLINTNPVKGAQIYVEDTGGKDTVEDMVAQIKDPQSTYTLAPKRIMPLAEFMHKVGLIKTMPSSWKDLFLPEVYGMDGS